MMQKLSGSLCVLALFAGFALGDEIDAFLKRVVTEPR